MFTTLKSLILASLICILPVEIVENTTLSTNVTITNDRSVCPAHEDPIESRICSLDEKPSVRCNINTNNDTETANVLHKLKELTILFSFLQQNVTREVEQLKELIKDCKNESKEGILTLRADIERSREGWGQLMENISNFRVDMLTMQHQVVDETKELRVHVASEDQTVRWMLKCILALEVLFFLLWCRKGKSNSRVSFIQGGLKGPQILYSDTNMEIHQKPPEMDVSEPVMENSVAVVSFSERNKDLHLNLARSVTSNFEIHQVYLGGMTNISTIGLPSKVCLVFVEKNKRNIILETDVDVSRTRASFVEGQIKQGGTQVIVIYCHHPGSRDIETLYDRSLGSIKKQETLRQLQRQNRVLSIDTDFSEYQSNHLKTILNEALC